jgi:hypothetical protein
MGREHPRASNHPHKPGPNDQARATTDEDRRAARRDLWAQAAAAAGYGEPPACSQDGAA